MVFFFSLVWAHVGRSPLWSTCQQSCMMLRKYLMQNSSGKLMLCKITSTDTQQVPYFWCHLGALTKQRWRSSQGKFFFLLFFDSLYFSVFTHSTVVKLYCFIGWWKSHQTDTETRTNTYTLSAACLCVPLSIKECRISTKIVQQKLFDFSLFYDQTPKEQRNLEWPFWTSLEPESNMTFKF